MSLLQNRHQPDKLGLIIQCRQAMDTININDLNAFILSITRIVSMEQCKTMLFAGLHAIKEVLEHKQLLALKATMNEIMKKPENTKKTKEKTETIVTKAKSLAIPKDASLSETIPKEIISNNICTFLRMASITKLAQCDRNLAIICHTPTSISNLMHRYDPYKYFGSERFIRIDGDYPEFYVDYAQMHRFQCIKKLAIHPMDFDIDHEKETLRDVQHLFVIDEFSQAINQGPVPGKNLIVKKHIQPFPSLQSISFSTCDDFSFVLWFFDKYKDETKQKYYNEIIHQLQSISFINCLFFTIPRCVNEEKEARERSIYANMVNLLLPNGSNNLQVLKLENSFWDKTEHPECNEANDEFANVERIKSSLCNLRGFAYAGPLSNFDKNEYYSNNLFRTLCENILMNLTSFKELKSLHLHSKNVSLLSLFLNGNDDSCLQNILELCCTVSMDERGKTLLTEIIEEMSHLNKLCLVIDLQSPQSRKKPNLEWVIHFIFRILVRFVNLKIFQIVFLCDHDFFVAVEDDDDEDEDGDEDDDDIPSLFFGNSLIKMAQSIYSANISQYEPLVFKLHFKMHRCKIPHTFVKFCESIRKFVLDYLLCFNSGHIQIKISGDMLDWGNIGCARREFKGLDKLLDFNLNASGTIEHLQRLNEAQYGQEGVACHNDKDYEQLAISAQAKNLSPDIVFDKAWSVDCQYCCNTPWV